MEWTGIEAAGEELFGFGLVLILRKEPFAFAGSPRFRKLIVVEKDVSARRDSRNPRPAMIRGLAVNTGP